MFTFNRRWFMALLMSLEALRRGQAGALMVGIFVSLNTDEPTLLYPRLGTLTELADMVLTLIDELPPAVQWVATPFVDYSKAII